MKRVVYAASSSAYGNTEVLPKVDVQVSGTLRTTPGTTSIPAFTANNAYLAANSTLGRPLSGNAANMAIRLQEDHETYNDRRNELDIRFGKVIRYRATRTVVSVDLYNALNANPVISSSTAYASWQRPQEILNARLVKFSIAFDF